MSMFPLQNHLWLSYKMKVLSNDYMVAFAGAVALAELYHDIWPLEHAVKTVKSLIGERL